ncbi:MAG: ATP-binding cassette domain-containing protein [Candidatus Aminicenantes bacterium]|nr:ATP-binding cassette domain-containing protein [Candidatus Aminicenantes bacterium]
MDIIQVRDLDVGYGAETIVRGLSFTVPVGRITVIVGESGSGKSTLLKTLIGLLPPLRGEVLLSGERIDFGSDRELRRFYRRIGVLYQNSALLNSLTLYENIALPIRMHHRDWAREKEAERVNAMLSRVGLDGHGAKYPFELSGGMRKRAALARAMVLEPDLVFCDEPSAGLDPITSSGLDALLNDLRTAHGVTFVVVTHELRSIARIADRILVIRDGRLHFNGEYSDATASPDSYLQAFFLRKAAS